MRPSDDELSRLLGEAFAKMAAGPPGGWGCVCPLDDHQWVDFDVFWIGYWGMSDKRPEPHLHKLLEFIEAGKEPAL